MVDVFRGKFTEELNNFLNNLDAVEEDIQFSPLEDLLSQPDILNDLSTELPLNYKPQDMIQSEITQQGKELSKILLPSDIIQEDDIFNLSTEFNIPEPEFPKEKPKINLIDASIKLIKTFKNKDDLEKTLDELDVEEEQKQKVKNLYDYATYSLPYFTTIKYGFPEDIQDKVFDIFVNSIENDEDAIPKIKKLLEDYGYNDTNKLKKLPIMQQEVVKNILSYDEDKIKKADVEDFVTNYIFEVTTGLLGSINPFLGLLTGLGGGFLLGYAQQKGFEQIDKEAFKLIELAKDNPKYLEELKQGKIPDELKDKIDIPKTEMSNIGLVGATEQKEDETFLSQLSDRVKQILKGEVLGKQPSIYSVAGALGDLLGVMTRAPIQKVFQQGLRKGIEWMVSEQLINMTAGYTIEETSNILNNILPDSKVLNMVLSTASGIGVAHGVSSVAKNVAFNKVFFKEATATPKDFEPIISNVKKEFEVEESLKDVVKQQLESVVDELKDVDDVVIDKVKAEKEASEIKNLTKTPQINKDISIAISDYYKAMDLDLDEINKLSDTVKPLYDIIIEAKEVKTKVLKDLTELINKGDITEDSIMKILNFDTNLKRDVYELSFIDLPEILADKETLIPNLYKYVIDYVDGYFSEKYRKTYEMYKKYILKYSGFNQSDIYKEVIKRSPDLIFNDLSRNLELNEVNILSPELTQSMKTFFKQHIKGNEQFLKQAKEIFTDLVELSYKIFENPNELKQVVEHSDPTFVEYSPKIITEFEIFKQYLNLPNDTTLPNFYSLLEYLDKKTEGKIFNYLGRGERVFGFLNFLAKVNRLVENTNGEDIFIYSFYQTLNKYNNLEELVKPIEVDFFYNLKNDIFYLKSFIDEYNVIENLRGENKEKIKSRFLPIVIKRLTKLNNFISENDLSNSFSSFISQMDKHISILDEVYKNFDKLSIEEILKPISNTIDLVNTLYITTKNLSGEGLSLLETLYNFENVFTYNKLGSITDINNKLTKIFGEDFVRKFGFYFISPYYNLPDAIKNLYITNETVRKAYYKVIGKLSGMYDKVYSKIMDTVIDFYLDLDKSKDLIKDILCAGILRKGELIKHAKQQVEAEYSKLKELSDNIKQLNLSENQIKDILKKGIYNVIEMPLSKENILYMQLAQLNLAERWLFRALEDTNSLAFRSLPLDIQDFILELRKIINTTYDLLSSRGLLPIETKQYKDKYIRYLYYIYDKRIKNRKLNTLQMRELQLWNTKKYLSYYIDKLNEYRENFINMYNYFYNKFKDFNNIDDLLGQKVELADGIEDYIYNIVKSDKNLLKVLQIPSMFSIDDFIRLIAYKVTQTRLSDMKVEKPQLLALIEGVLNKSLIKTELDISDKHLKLPSLKLLEQLGYDVLPYRKVILNTSEISDEVLDKVITFILEKLEANKERLTPLSIFSIIEDYVISSPEFFGTEAGMLLKRKYLDLSLKDFFCMNLNPFDAVLQGINQIFNVLQSFDVFKQLVSNLNLVVSKEEALNYPSLYVPVDINNLGKRYKAIPKHIIQAIVSLKVDKQTNEVYIHKGLLQLFNEFNQLQQEGKTFFKEVRKILRDLAAPFKIVMALWSPAVMVRNILGNFIPVALISRSYIQGLRYYLKGIKAMVLKDSDYHFLNSKGLIRAEAGVFQELSTINLSLNKKNKVEKIKDFLVNLIDLYSNGKIIDFLSRCNAFFDDSARIGVYKYLKEHGYETPINDVFKYGTKKEKINALLGKLPKQNLTSNEIINLVREFSFDYYDIPEGVKILRDTLMPFASFPYLTLRMYGKTLMSNPISAIKFLLLPLVIDLLLQEYGDYNINIETIVPGSEFAQSSTNLFFTPTAFLRTIVSHPVVAPITSILIGRDLYSGKSIYNVFDALYGNIDDRLNALEQSIKYLTNQFIRNYIPSIWQMFGWELLYSFSNSDLDILSKWLTPPWEYQYIKGYTNKSVDISPFLRLLYLAGIKVEPVDYTKLKQDILKGLYMSKLKAQQDYYFLKNPLNKLKSLGKTPQELYKIYSDTYQNLLENISDIQEYLEYLKNPLLYKYKNDILAYTILKLLGKSKDLIKRMVK